MAQKKQSDPLKVMFPGEKIELSTGNKITVRPLTLEDFPKVTDTLGDLLEKFTRFKEEQSRAEESGEEIPSNITLLKIGMKEIVKLIPFCVDEQDMSKIPVSALPEILTKIVELNFTEDTVKNWTGLFRTLIGFVPAGEALRQTVVKNTTSPEQSQSESNS